MNYMTNKISNTQKRAANNVNGIPPMHQKQNKRSRSTYSYNGDKTLKIQNGNNRSMINHEANMVIQNLNKKAQTPHIEVTNGKKMGAYKQNQSTQNSKNKKILFTQLNKQGSMDNYIGQSNVSPHKRSTSKGSYNTINYNQNYLNQTSSNNNTSNSNALKKYLTAQQNNISKITSNSVQKYSNNNHIKKSGIPQQNQQQHKRSRNQNKSVHNCQQFQQQSQQMQLNNNNSVMNINHDHTYSQILHNDNSYDTFINTSTINKYINQSSSTKTHNTSSLQSYGKQLHNFHGNQNINSNSNDTLLYNNNLSINNPHLNSQNFANISQQIQIQQQQSKQQYSLNQQQQQQKSQKILQSKQQQEQDQQLQKAKKYFLQGKKYFKQNQLQNAIECFQQALIIWSDFLDVLYLLGVCYLSKQEYQKCIDSFSQLIEKQPKYKQNVYLLLSIAYKKKNDTSTAIKMLGLAIQNFPNYYDAYIYRGKLLVKAKQYEKALKDFECSVNLDNSKPLGYIGKADCLRALNRFGEAVKFYSFAIQTDKNIKKVALLKKAITYSENQQYQESLQDLQDILEEDPFNSEACYFKGIQYQKLGNINEAILAFEQAIKHNNSKKAVSKSLYEIAKIKIDLRDFYQAFYTLQRSEYLDVDQELLKPFKIFSDGVTYLMKRKYQEGVDSLNQVVKIINKNSSNNNSNQTSNQTSTSNFLAELKSNRTSNNQNNSQQQQQQSQPQQQSQNQNNNNSGNNSSDILKKIIYPYRAYGLMCLGQHQKAYQDILMHEQVQNELEESTKYNKYICQGIIQILEKKYDQGFENFKEAGKLLTDKMEPLFYKGMGICYQVFQKYDYKKEKQKINQYCQNALLCLEKAEQMNSQNYSLYYGRALIYFALEMYDEAMADVEKAIDKCETNTAENFYIRGLIQGGQRQYQTALGDFSIAINLDDKFPLAYINRAKCYQILGDRNAAFEDLQKYIALKPNDSKIHQITGNLLFSIGAHEDAIKAYTRQGNVDQNRELLQLRINCYVVSKELNFALNDMQKLIDLTADQKVNYDLNCLSSIKKVSQCDQKDVENFIKIYQDGLSQLKSQNRQSKKLQQQKNSRSTQDGVIFKQSDLKFFQGLYYFFLGQYDKALIKFNKSIDCIRPQETNRTNQQEEEHPQAELIEEYKFENMTYNIYEFQYNAAICYVMVGQIEEALKVLKLIQEVIPANDANNLTLLIQNLEKEIDTSIPQPKELPQNPQQLEIFTSVNRLCSIFPQILLPLEKSKIEIRLSFCLPTIISPSLEVGFDQSIIDKLSPTLVENKPEAPWIKKNALGVQFTDNMLELSQDLTFTETKRSKQGDENQTCDNNQQSKDSEQDQLAQQEQEELSRIIHDDFQQQQSDFTQDKQQFQYTQQQQQQQNNQQDISKSQHLKQLKQNLQLDAGISDKLNKILKNQ